MIEELQRKVRQGEGRRPQAARARLCRCDPARACADKIREVKGKPGKHDRSDAVKKILEDLINEMAPPVTDPNASYLSIVAQQGRGEADSRGLRRRSKKQVTREAILAGRSAGRPQTTPTIRAISCAGRRAPARARLGASSRRGETQSMCTVTLGTSSRRAARRRADRRVQPEIHAALQLPAATAWARFGRSAARAGARSATARWPSGRSIAVLPGVEQFPYTVRVICDILESNGSSSMASAAAARLALMDAGVPITKPVAGISVGLVKEGDAQELLTDIIGEEDHFGDMDFKVCGTRDGITAIQLDIKIEGIDHDIIRDTLHRAKEARLIILDKHGRRRSTSRGRRSASAHRAC